MLEEFRTPLPLEVVFRPLPALGDESCLSPEETTRAGSYVIAEARRRFVAARTILRAVLGARLGLDPAQVPLARTADGKPFVAGFPLAFSLSHAGGHIAIALSTEPAIGIGIGIDIEPLRPLPDAAAMAARFLPPADHRTVAEQRDDQSRARAFLAAWTRHEAVAKALGLPLSNLLARPGLGEGIHVRPLDLPPGWIGHVAADGPVG